MIDLRDVTKRYDDFTALHDVSLHIPAGSLTALLGPSGSGKSISLGGRRVVPAGSDDAGGYGIQCFHRRQLVRAAPNRAANAMLTCLDEVVDAEPDPAVTAYPDGRDAVVDLGTLEAVHRALLGTG